MSPSSVTGALPWANHALTLDDLADLLRRPAWQADGACREHPEISWFVSRGESAAPARRICASCLVRPECATWAAGQGSELHGVWGGLTDHDRRIGITTPRPTPAVTQARCRRCGGAREDLTARLCSGCRDHAGPWEERTGPCVKCGHPIEANIRRVEGHPLHGSSCYYRVRREAVKLGTTIEAIVEQLVRFRARAG